jgi:choline-sulfatase
MPPWTGRLYRACYNRQVRLAAIFFLVIALWVAACGGGSSPGSRARPNVLLVTIDTFRADRIGTGVAPAIERLAASGLRFTAARTTAPLTLPAHTSIHTGLLPPGHGVRENGAQLAGTHLTLGRMLHDHGYDTAAFVGAYVLDRRFGLAQGFETYDDQIPRDPSATERLEAERPASAVIDRVIAWLGARSAPSPQARPPFFLWVHLYDPHAPYEPPAEYRARAATPYDGEIAYADAQLARLLDSLRAQGQLDRTLIVVAGDHGEGLGDHGERTHGMLVYDSTLRVPLVVVEAGVAAATRDEAVSLIDIAPTILRAAGAAPAEAMKGRDLLGGARRTDRDDLYSETDYPRAAGWSLLQALTDGRWMAIRAGAATELYDLQMDPGQQHDVAAAHQTIAVAMAAKAEAIHAAAAASATPTISADAQERLRALGYVAGSGAARPAPDARNPSTAIVAWNEFEDALAALGARRPDALERLRAIAAAYGDAPVFQTTYARALREHGQLDTAITVYRQALRRWPADATLLHDLAVAVREAANRMPGGAEARALRDEAVRAEEAALALDSNSATAQNGLGLIAVDNDRAAEAVMAFERAAAIDPNNATYWTNLGNARRALGNGAGAGQAYRKALDVDPRAADAANGLGVLLVEARQPADATAWFERAIAAAPDLVEARLNLGIALQQLGQTERAAAEYRHVLESPPRYKREREAASKLLASLGAAR